MDIPKNYEQAKDLNESGHLHDRLKYALILLAFSDDHTMVRIRAIEALLAMPGVAIKDWTSGMSKDELLQADEFLTNLRHDLLEQIKNTRD